MALQDYDKTRTYTKYKRHVDESKERITAKDINKIQNDVNEQQAESNAIKDTAFEERVYTIFQNNLYANAMFLDRFKNGEHINFSLSTASLDVDYNKHCIFTKSGTTYAEAVSLTIESVHGPGINLNDFFLVTNETIPTGAKTEWFIENVLGEMFPISPNKLKTPMHFTQDIENGFKIHVRMYTNSLGESPIINGYAVLYWDEKIEADLKANTPDLARFQEVELNHDDGMTILIRDRAQEDKIVRVEEPNDTVKLTYFWDTEEEDSKGRLWFVSTHWPYYQGHEVTQMHKLYYGDYTNSEGETESVLKKIGQATDVGTTLIENPWLDRIPEPEFDEVAAENASVVATNLSIGYGGDEDV